MCQVVMTGNRKSVKSNNTSINEDTTTTNTDADMTLDTDNKAKSKKQKGFRQKKAVTGFSNWSLLCSQLKKDPCSRKRKTTESSGSKDGATVVKKAKPEIWFDDVDESLLKLDDETAGKKKTSQSANKAVTPSAKSLVKDECFTGLTKCIGIDCEMVGAGDQGHENALARVSLVNVYGHCLYDKFVIPQEKVVDYRTAVSGVTKELIEEKGEPFLEVQKEVSELVQGAVLVGHALSNDLRALYMTHPGKDIRDTSLYKPFRDLFDGKKPSLKKLTQKLLGVSVQEGEHSSVEDAQAAMRLYTMHKARWEKTLKENRRFMEKRKAKKSKKKTVMEETEEALEEESD